MLQTNQNQKGSVLIMTIGVLAILSALAATFVTAMRMEAKMAVNYTDTVQAELLAQSAFEYALAVLIKDGAETYTSTSQPWTKNFDGSDITVWPYSSGNDAKWIEVFERNNIKGEMALKIIDQSALIYAGNSYNVVEAMFKYVTSGDITLDGEIATKAFSTYLDRDLVALDADLALTDKRRVLFSTLTYMQSGAIIKAPLNINTHYDYVEHTEALKMVLSGTKYASDIIPKLSMDNTSASKIENWNSLIDKIVGSGLSIYQINDALNILLNFQEYELNKENFTRYKKSDKTYYNCDDFTNAHDILHQIDLSNGIYSTLFNSDSKDWSDKEQDLGKDTSRFVNYEIILKSQVFEVWGRVRLTDTLNNKILGEKAFSAIIDRGDDSAKSKLLRFQWIDPL